VPPGADIGDDLKKDILGARRKLLFVEGANTSPDKPLYSLVFPDVSIVAKSGYREVSGPYLEYAMPVIFIGCARSG